MKLRGITDVPRRIHPHTTPQELDALTKDDEDLFSLLVVAEAVLPRVPLGIVTWLRQPHVSAEWLETLILHEGLHQIAWWTRTRALGLPADHAYAPWNALCGIRARMAEAEAVVAEQTRPRSHSASESRALNRLREAHAQEWDAMVAELRAKHNLPADPPVTTGVQKLLNLDDDAFRRLVGGDVNNRVHVKDLAHRAVSSRWRDALIELGVNTLAGLGLPTTKIDKATDRRSFTVPDKKLPVGPLDRDEIAAWVARLTFLAHLRVRLRERAMLRHKANRAATDLIYQPAEEHLRLTYFAEYARYRLENNSSPAPTTATEQEAANA
jgi:hypothetical protein